MAPRSPEHVALGLALRAAREKVGVSQEELAARSDLHRTYYAGIERGERNPSYSNLLRVSIALETPLWRLVKQAEPES